MVNKVNIKKKITKTEAQKRKKEFILHRHEIRCDSKKYSLNERQRDALHCNQWVYFLFFFLFFTFYLSLCARV